MAHLNKNVALISWREMVALVQVCKERESYVTGATDEERENKWKELDDKFADQMIKNVQSSISLKKRDGPKKEQEVKPYVPPRTRLLLSYDLQKHNVHCDPGISPGACQYTIPVFCDIPSQCTDFFLSDGFHYRLGRPFRLGIEFDDDAAVPNTVSDIYKLPQSLRLFAHSEQGTCICFCDDCTKNPNCECALLASVLNMNRTRLKNGTFVYNDVEINCEEAKSLLIGCGQACKCYEHGKCERNIDLLHTRQPKLEIYRNDTEMNFRVRTLQTLHPGDFIAEFTGHLETRDEIDPENHPKAYDYAFQIIFSDSDKVMTKVMCEKLDNPQFKEFKTLYKDFMNFKENCHLREIFIQPYDFGNVAQFIAHGCMPNCLVVRAVANHVFPQFHRLLLFANHIIPAGSELFINYGGEYVERFRGNCRCDTLLCRAVDNRGLTDYDSVHDYIKDIAFPCIRMAAGCRESEIKLNKKLNCKIMKREHLGKIESSRDDIPRIKPESLSRANENKVLYDLLKDRTEEFKDNMASLIELFLKEKGCKDRKEQKRQTINKGRPKQKKIDQESYDIVDVYTSVPNSITSSQAQSRALETLRKVPPTSYHECEISPLAKDKEKTRRKRKHCTASRKINANKEKGAHDYEPSSVSSEEPSTNVNNDDDIIWLDDDGEDCVTSCTPEITKQLQTDTKSKRIDSGHDTRPSVKKSKTKPKIEKSKKEDGVVSRSTMSSAARKEGYMKQKQTYDSILPSRPRDVQDFRIPKKPRDQVDESPVVEPQVGETSLAVNNNSLKKPHRFGQHLTLNNHSDSRYAHTSNISGYDFHSSYDNNSNYDDFNEDDYDGVDNDYSPQSPEYSRTGCFSPEYSPTSARYSPEPAILPQRDVNYDVVSMDISNTSLCCGNNYQAQSGSLSPVEKTFNLKAELLQPDSVESEGEQSSLSVSQIPLPEGPPPDMKPLPIIEEVDELDSDEKRLIEEEGEEAEREYNASLKEQLEADELAYLKKKEKERKKEKKRNKKKKEKEKEHSKKRHRRSHSVERSVSSPDSQPRSRAQRESSCSSIEWI